MLRFAALLLLCCFALVARAGPLDPDFDNLERALRLKPNQKVQFDVAVAATRRALLATATAGMEAKERVTRELEKARPDLNVAYDIYTQVMQQTGPAYREARDEWSKLFALMDDEQVAITKRYIEDRLNILVPK